jgi:hypothetical protein
MKENNLIRKGNASLVVGALLGISAATICPCPFCILSGGALIFNGVREKLAYR